MRTALEMSSRIARERRLIERGSREDYDHVGDVVETSSMIRGARLCNSRANSGRRRHSSSSHSDHSTDVVHHRSSVASPPKNDHSRETLPTAPEQHGVSSTSSKSGPPRAPDFVLYAGEALAWVGVKHITPEVLRQAKRDSRDPNITTKLWRALLHVCLLHLDSESRLDKAASGAKSFHHNGQETCCGQAASIFSRCEARGHVHELRGRSTDASLPKIVEEGCRAGDGHDISRTKHQEQRAEETLAANRSSRIRKNSAVPTEEAGSDATPDWSRIPIETIAEASIHLLLRWGYRQWNLINAVRAGDIMEAREVLVALAWVMAEAKVFQAYQLANVIMEPRPAADLSDNSKPSTQPSCKESSTLQSSHDIASLPGLHYRGDLAAHRNTVRGQGKLDKCAQDVQYSLPGLRQCFPKDVTESAHHVASSRAEFINQIRNIEHKAMAAGQRAQNWMSWTGDDGAARTCAVALNTSANDTSDRKSARVQWAAGGRTRTRRREIPHVTNERERGLEHLRSCLEAVRELMLCHGALEAELRILQELETSRAKLVARLQSRQADLNMFDSPKTDPGCSKSRTMRAPLSKEISPFLLCTLMQGETELRAKYLFLAVQEREERLRKGFKGISNQQRWEKWMLSMASSKAATAEIVAQPRQMLRRKHDAADDILQKPETVISTGRHDRWQSSSLVQSTESKENGQCCEREGSLCAALRAKLAIMTSPSCSETNAYMTAFVHELNNRERWQEASSSVQKTVQSTSTAREETSLHSAKECDNDFADALGHSGLSLDTITASLDARLGLEERLPCSVSVLQRMCREGADVACRVHLNEEGMSLANVDQMRKIDRKSLFKDFVHGDHYARQDGSMLSLAPCSPLTRRNLSSFGTDMGEPECRDIRKRRNKNLLENMLSLYEELIPFAAVDLA